MYEKQKNSEIKVIPLENDRYLYYSACEVVQDVLRTFVKGYFY